MDRKLAVFEEVLTSEYEHERFIIFVKEFFTELDIKAPNIKEKLDSNFKFYVSDYSHIGNVKSKDGSKIAVFSVCLNKEEAVLRARGVQRNFVKRLMEQGGCAAALVAFFTEAEPEKWRLSFIRMDYEFAKGKVIEKLTPAKRYSYLVGKGEPCHTAKQRLYPIFKDDEKKLDIDELEEAFSVEKVTNEFFNLYKEKYLRLKEELEDNEEFMEEANYRNFTSEQFVKKLMGQIVFLYFIQKKGWLGVNAFPKEISEKEYKNAFYAKGSKSRELIPLVYKKNSDGKFTLAVDDFKRLSEDNQDFLASLVRGKAWGTGPKDFMRKIFDNCIKEGKNFFDDYLEPLFYTGLNQYRGKNGYYPPLHCRIPFLNGGLFEQLDNYEWENNNFNIPNSLFSNVDEKDREADGILDIFERYNFTMNEDEPMEREVAIDPEMLGKVFENLLEVKDRKSKGAFYTPREIVHYMCQETLIQHLVTKTGISESDVRDFILYGDLMKDEDTSKEVFEGDGEMLISQAIFDRKTGVNRLKELDEVLANVKVADLAVGSGAFPLGMLNEIVRAREVLSAYMSLGMNNFQKKAFYSYDRQPYALKLNTIKNCIFACDIEPSAVDIAKLRLWLSLVIDDEIKEVDGNYNFNEHSEPKQLPNLECNIVCGNSLIDEFMGIPLITESELLHNLSIDSQLTLNQKGIDSMISTLIALQNKLFHETNHDTKEEMKSKIQSIYDNIILEQLKVNKKAIEEYESLENESSKPFILWQLYFPRVFRENGGFDIVIGNPPYVGEKGNKEIFRPISQTEFGKKFYQGKMDLFYFFFHKGIDLGNKDAEIALITTNYYPTAFGAKKLREDIKERTQVRRLINFNEMKVFESALGQHNMITMLTKNNDNKKMAKNSFYKRVGIATKEEIKAVLYAGDSKNDDYDMFFVPQDELYEGKENYIRIMGLGIKDDNLLSRILSKIGDTKYCLIDIAFIKQGIVSGADKFTDAHAKKYGIGEPKGKGIFVLQQSEVEKLNLPEDERIYVKKVYKNSQISKYQIHYHENLYVFYLTKEVSENKIPSILDYLRVFKPILESKREVVQGKLPWYSLNWARDKNIFEAPEKIVNSRRAKSNIFALETRGYYEQSDIMVTVINPKFQETFPTKYVLGLLNSSLLYVWLKHKGKLKGDMLELYGKPLEEIPIKAPDENSKKQIIDYVEMLLSDENCNLIEVQSNIDEIIYKMYGLTKEEIEFIENNKE